jgi:hypothetical protein
LILDFLVQNNVKIENKDEFLEKLIVIVESDKVFSSKIDANVDLITNFYASLSNFEDYGLEENDKSVNAHNCRKFVMLTKMFICHKLIVLFDLKEAKF